MKKRNSLLCIFLILAMILQSAGMYVDAYAIEEEAYTYAGNEEECTEHIDENVVEYKYTDDYFVDDIGSDLSESGSGDAQTKGEETTISDSVENPSIETPDTPDYYTDNTEFVSTEAVGESDSHEQSDVQISDVMSEESEQDMAAMISPDSSDEEISALGTDIQPQGEGEVTSITLDKTTISLVDDDFTGAKYSTTIVATITPAEAATDTVEVVSENSSLVSIGSKNLSENKLTVNITVNKPQSGGTISTKVNFKLGDASASTDITMKVRAMVFPAAPQLDGKNGVSSVALIGSAATINVYEGEYYYLKSSTKDAQIFYTTGSPNWNSFLTFNSTTKTYSVNPSYASTVFEYGNNGALVAGKAPITTEGPIYLYTIAVKGTLDYSDTNSTAVFKLNYILGDRWGDIIEEDREFYVPYSKDPLNPGKIITSPASEYYGKDDGTIVGIPNGVWIPANMFSPENTTYTGSKITIPDLRVYYRNRLLNASTDYTVTYADNINVANQGTTKMPSVKIKLKGNYSGSATFAFTIFPKPYNESDNDNRFDISPIYLGTGTSNTSPKPSVSYDGRKLALGKDYMIKGYTLDGGATIYDRVSTEGFDEGENIRSYGLVIEGLNNQAGTGNGNYYGIKTISGAAIVLNSDSIITMDKVSIAKIPTMSVDVENPSNTLKPQPKITYKKKQLPITAFVYSYGPNNTAGKGRVTVTGLGIEEGRGLEIEGKTYYFVGSKSSSFTIKGIPMSKVTIKDIPAQTYTGSAIKPEDFHGTLKCGNLLDGTLTLNEGVDYKVSYKNNKNAGTATATFKGLGAFTGTRTKTFTINPAPFTNYELRFKDSSTGGVFPYAKGGVKPAIEVYKTVNGTDQILSAKNYVVTYRNNTSVGNASVTVEPILNLTGGSRALSYTITPASISGCTMSVSDKIASKKAGKFIQKPTIYNAYGQKLKAGTDYVALSESSYTYGEDAVISQKSGKNTVNGIKVYAGEQVSKYDIVPAGTVINITVIGKGNYAGSTTQPATLTGSYKIAKAKIKSLKFKIYSKQFTGYQIRPVKSDIYVNGSNSSGRAYYEIVSYGVNTSVGTGTVTVRGIGDYVGTKTISFKIKKAKN